MGLYLMYGKYNPGSLEKISAERTEKAKDLVQENGGTIKSSYALLGEQDLLIIANFPNVKSVVKTSVEMGNLLGLTFSTIPAITIEEFDSLF